MFVPNIYFIVKASLVYGSTALAFSVLSTVLPGAFVIGNPFEVSNVTPEHIIGHIIWGLIAGLAFFSLRYIILAGLFSIVLDADHLLQLLDLLYRCQKTRIVLHDLVIILVVSNNSHN